MGNSVAQGIKKVDLPTPRFDAYNSYKICLGAWAWGGNVAEFGPDALNLADQEAAFRAAVESGLGYFDTAEAYSNGESEKLLGKFIKNYSGDQKVHVATKFVPTPWRISACNLERSLSESLKRLQLEKVSLFMVHGPAFSIRSVDVWAEELANVYEKGLCDAVGVSNYNSQQIMITYQILARRGIQLVSNQIEYSLLHTIPEYSGVIDTCKRLGVKIYAYSPLAQGRLTGKYSKENPPKGDRRFGGASWQIIAKVVEVLKKIGEKHANQDGPRTPAQVALAWIIAKGAIPVFGVKDEKQTIDSCKCIEFELDSSDVDQLDKVSFQGTLSYWQGNAH